METQELYEPKPLKEKTSVLITSLAQTIESGNVLAIIGAGISMSPPTLLPSGSEIARKVKQGLSQTSLASSISSCPEDDLLAIADTAESQSHDARNVLQKLILNSFDFTTAPYNFAHLVISLLMAEGNLHVLSMNWDTCVERSAIFSRSDILPCRNLTEFRQTGNKAILIKLHGCATIEDSILISTEQFEETQWWITSQVEALFARNMVLFLGIGSIPRYIERTTKKLLEFTKGSSPIYVVTSRLSTEWTTLLSTTGSLQSISSTAQEFLDDILRSLTCLKLGEVQPLVTEIAPDITDFDIQAAVSDVLNILYQYPAHLIWLWLRRSIFPNTCAQTILSPTFVHFVIALALLHTISPLQEIKQLGEVVFARCEHFVIELAWARTQMSANTLRKKKIEALKADVQRRSLPQSSPFMIIAVNCVGKLPSPVMPISIMDKPAKSDIISGAEIIVDYWISLDDLMRIHDKSTLMGIMGIQNG